MFDLFQGSYQGWPSVRWRRERQQRPLNNRQKVSIIWEHFHLTLMLCSCVSFNPLWADGLMCFSFKFHICLQKRRTVYCNTLESGLTEDVKCCILPYFFFHPWSFEICILREIFKFWVLIQEQFLLEYNHFHGLSFILLYVVVFLNDFNVFRYITQ